MKRTVLGLFALMVVAAIAAIPSFASGSGSKGRVIDLAGVTTSTRIALATRSPPESRRETSATSQGLFPRTAAGSAASTGSAS